MNYPDKMSGMSQVETAFPFNVSAAIDAVVASSGAPPALQPALVLACASFLKTAPSPSRAISPDAFATTIHQVWPDVDDFVIENLQMGLEQIAIKGGVLAD